MNTNCFPGVDATTTRPWRRNRAPHALAARSPNTQAPRWGPLCLAGVAVSLGLVGPVSAADGDLDPGFNPNAGAVRYGGPGCGAVQTDGKILLGGDFGTMGGVARNRLARVNADGTLDLGFNPNVDSAVLGVAVQGDGKILAVGYFNTVGGIGRNYVARLNGDGTLDPSFNPNANGWLFSVAVQADGKILLGGQFTAVGGVTRNHIARLQLDGSLDSSFNPNANGDVYPVVIQADGKILLGGGFTAVGGTTHNHLARLNLDGSVEGGFKPNVEGDIATMVVQPDGKIVLGGPFHTIGGTGRNHIARLHADGTLDAGFDPNANADVCTVALQADGKILIGGDFTTVGGTARTRVARLHPDGAVDASFDPSGGPNARVYMAVPQPDGQILLGGDFTTVGGQSRGYVARLRNTPATQSLSVLETTRVQWLRAGTTPEIAQATLELSGQNGCTWMTLGSGQRIAGGWEWTGLNLPTSGVLRARGRATGGYSSGTSSVLEQAQVFNFGSGAPEIAVEQPAGTDLPDGSSRSFGTVSPGSLADLTFTLKNTGSADLLGLCLTLDGPEASQFSVIAYPTAPLSGPGGLTSFTVRFAPTTAGAKMAVLHLANNDPDENPFDIVLAGSAVGPWISQQPVHQLAVVGGTATLRVVAGGIAPLAYQWRFNGTNLPTATATNLYFSNVRFADAGNYDVVVANAAGAITSQVAVLTVQPCQEPPPGVVGWWPGDAHGLDLSAYGNHGRLVGGATAAPGLVGQAFNLNGHEQFVEVPANPAFDLTNDFTIALWFYQRSSIGNGYRLVDRCTAGEPDGFAFDTWPGTQLRFVARAEVRANTTHSLNAWHHAAVTFQNSTATLYLDGQPVGSASGMTVGWPKDMSLRFGAAHPGCGGSCGLVEYLNGLLDEVALFNRALSANEITVLFAARGAGTCGDFPLISADQTVLAGDTATFSVESREQALSYQWRKDGASLPDATNNMLVIPDAQLPQAGAYDVVATYAQGSATSTVARLIVTVFARQPESQGVPLGSNALFSVQIGGLLPPVSFQWQYNGADVPQGDRLSGANTASLSIRSLQLSDAGAYRVVVSNAVGVATSVVAMLVVETCVAPPAGLVGWWRGDGNGEDSALGQHGFLTNGARFGSGKVGQAFTFDGTNAQVVAPASDLPVGDSDRTLALWVKMDAEVAGKTFFAGYGAPASWNGAYVLLGQGGALTFPRPSPWAPAVRGGTLQLGRWHHVAVTSSGSILTLYLDGQTVASEEVPIATPAGSQFYLGRAPGSYGNDCRLQGQVDEVGVYNRALEPSEIVALYVAGSAGQCHGVPFFVVPPQSQRVLPGSNVTFNVRIGASSSTATYQWQYHGAPLADGGRISGVLTPTLTLSSAQVNDAGAYRVVVNNEAGSVTSAAARLRVDVCTAPPSGLAAWWPGEGNAEDRVSTNHGTLVGGTSFVPGFVGQAFSFSQWSDAVTFPDSAAFRPSTITLEAWVKGGPQDAYGYILGKAYNSGGASYALYTSVDGSLVFYVRVLAGDVVSPSAGTRVWDNQYHHVAGTYDGSFVRLYIDGVQVGDGTPGHGAIRYSQSFQGGGLFLGCYRDTGAQALLGQVDEPGLYHRALDSNEIAAVYEAGLAGKCPGAPLISRLPAFQSIGSGSNAVFTVEVRGEAPLGYRWLFQGTSLSDGPRVSGATTATLTLTDVRREDAGLYSVVVSNPIGSTLGATALYVDVVPILADTVIEADDMTYEGQGLLVSGSTLTVNGRHAFNSLQLENQSLLTHAPASSGETNHRLDLTIAQDMVLEPGCWVDVSGLGYGPQSGPGTGAFGGDEGVGYGAGYGGRGGGSGGGVTYGSATEPMDFGSGGGWGWDWTAGAGGGAIRLAVNGTLRLDGTFAANGAAAGTESGGGSGGSIWVRAGSLVGIGTVSANGGTGATGGGGGRVAFHVWGTNVFPRANLHADGGSPLGQPGSIVVATLTPVFAWTSTPGEQAHGAVTLAWAPRQAADPDAIRAQLVAYRNGTPSPIASNAPSLGSTVWDTTAVPDGECVIKAVFSDLSGRWLGELASRTVVNNSLAWHAGALGSSVLWSNDVVHLVEVTLTIGSGATLTLLPGTIVKFVRGAGIVLADGATLQALGTEAAPIVLTSLADDSAGGDSNLDGAQSRPLPGDWTLTVAGGGQLLANEFFARRYTTVVYSGTLAGDTTWAGLLLYRVTDNLSVPEGVTLTIQPGAIVKFDADKALAVFAGGRLVAEGTVAQPITFTSIKDDTVGGDANGDGDASTPAAGDWRRLRVQEGGVASLRHAEVRYGGLAGGMVLCNGGTLDMEGCVLRRSDTDGLFAASNSVVIVTNSVIAEADRGVVAEGEVTLIHCLVSGHRQGVVEHGGTLTVRNSLVVNNTEVGVLHDLGADRVTVTFSDVWNPAGANYSGTADRAGWNGNLSADPLFKNPARGDFRLHYRSPAIDAADGLVAPSADFLGAPRYDDPRTLNRGVATASGAYADMGAFEFVETAASEVDLVALAVDGPSWLVAGQNATVEWMLVNFGSGEAIGPWHDTVLLAPAAAPSNTLWAGEVLVGQGLVLGPGESCVASAVVRVPGAIESDYLWQVHVNSRGEVFEGALWTNNTTLADLPSVLTVPTLAVGEPPVSREFSSAGESHWFKFGSPTDLDVDLALDLAGSGGASELYVGQGYVPTRQHYDFRHTQWNEPDARLLVPAAPGQIYYVLAYAQSLPVTPTGFTLRAQAKGFAITSVQPGSVGNVGCVTLEIQGSQLRTGDVFEVVPATGSTIQALTNPIVHSGLAYATFDLTGAAPGVWDLRVRRAGVTTTLPQALTVEAGGGPQAWATIVGRDRIRPGRKYDYEVYYGNSGNLDGNIVVVISGIPNNAQIELGPQFVPPPWLPGMSLGSPPYFPTPSGLILTRLTAAAMRPGDTARATFALTVSAEAPFGIESWVFAGSTFSNQYVPLRGSLTAPAAAVMPVERKNASVGDVNPNCLCYGGLQQELAGLNAALQCAMDNAAQNNFAFNASSIACVGVASNMVHWQLKRCAAENSALSGFTATVVTHLSGMSGSGFYNELGGGHTTVLLTSPCGNSWILDDYMTGPHLLPATQMGPNSPVYTVNAAGPLLIEPAPGLSTPDMWCQNASFKPQLLGDCNKPPPEPPPGPYPNPLCLNCCPKPDPIPPKPIEIIVSHDPNVKMGPDGVGAGNFIPGDEPLAYRIDFENQASASAPAQEVRVTDGLSTNLDWSTFELRQIGFNGVVIAVPASLQTFSTITHVTTDPNPVQVSAALDPATGIVTWRMLSLDPVTGQLVEDPLAGFLPPNNAAQQGEGFVSYTVQPKRGLPTGAQIVNQASIVFDVNAPIATPAVTNIIDAAPPTSRMLALPAVSGRTFAVQWTGQDDPGGSGVASYDVYVSTNGTDYNLWQWATDAPEAYFSGELGGTYSFHVLAADWVWNEELVPIHFTQTTVASDAPVLGAISNQVATVGDPLTLTNQVTGRPVGSFLFSLGLGAPAGASLNPSNGVFRWTPTCAQASRTHRITVWVTDTGRTNLRDAVSFSVVTRECVQPVLGRVVLQACDSARVPLHLVTSVPLTNLVMTLEAPSNRVTGLVLEPLLPEICAHSLQPLGDGLHRVSFAACGNQWLIGTQTLAWLHFTAVCSQSSAFVDLNIFDTEGRQPDGTPARNFAAQAGRLVVVGNEPLLEAALLSNGQPVLRLYAPEGTTNVLEATATLSPPAWAPEQQFILTNLWQDLDPIATNQSRFFRAVRF